MGFLKNLFGGKKDEEKKAPVQKVEAEKAEGGEDDAAKKLEMFLSRGE